MQMDLDCTRLCAGSEVVSCCSSRHVRGTWERLWRSVDVCGMCCGVKSERTIDGGVSSGCSAV